MKSADADEKEELPAEDMEERVLLAESVAAEKEDEREVAIAVACVVMEEIVALAAEVYAVWLYAIIVRN